MKTVQNDLLALPVSSELRRLSLDHCGTEGNLKT